ncbi:MAG: M12 family metallo-peptidase [Planctomycetota bacterium]|jgi:hypothetical protein
MSNIAENWLSPDIGCRQACMRTIFLAWLAAVILVAMGNPAFADNVATAELSSPLWLADIESLDMGTSLTLSENAYEIMAELQTVRLTDFPLSREENVDLDLEQFSITTPTTRIVAGTEEGDIPIAPPDISLFRGSISDVADSRVVLGISPRGCHGILWNGQKGHVITPIQRTREAGVDMRHVIHKLSDLPAPDPKKAPWCGGTLEPDEGPAPIEMAPIESTTAQFRSVQVALECDYDFWDQFNDLEEALEYIYVLFGAGNDIFQRDVSVKITLNYIRIWTTINDPYSFMGGEIGSLHEFRDYWNAYHNPGQSGFVSRDIAHLLSSRPINGWGTLGVLCNYEHGFSISGGNHLLQTLAENLMHDVSIVFHELGHNHNALHTNELDPPIDCCVAQGQCAAQDCSAPVSRPEYRADASRDRFILSLGLSKSLLCGLAEHIWE